MYVESVPNRGSPPAILLRESYREDGKVRKRTLLNLSAWPRERVEGLRALLKGGVVMPPGAEPLQIIRTLPHGHVSAVLGVIGKIGLDRLLGPQGNRPRDLVLAMIVSRIIAPASKLATTKGLNPMAATTSLSQILGLGEVAYAELYQALDWLLARQPAIETALARRHLTGGRWCSTMSVPAMSRGAAARWPNAAITAMARRASYRSSTACSVQPMAVR
jgi:hypothetical protein